MACKFLTRQPAFSNEAAWVGLGLRNSEKLGHFIILKSLSGNVGLHPRAIDHELRNGPLAGALDHFLRRAGRLFNIDLIVGDVVLGKPALRDMAVAAPGSGIDG
jgi:hypothetical protein